MMVGDSRRQVNTKPIQKSAPESDRSSVQSLVRAIDLLELLAEQQQGLRLVDIVGLAGIPASTAHRLLTTLESRRFVYLDKSSHCWNVGSRCLAVGATFGRQRNIGALALPAMQRLRDRSEQTVNLALVDSNEMVLIGQARGRDAPRGIARPGARISLTATALGQSIIAQLPETVMDDIVKTHQRRTEHPDAVKGSFAQTIRETRQGGFALDDEINCAGLRCIAATIFNEFAVPIAAISVAGASARIKVEHLGDIARDVRLAAQEVTQAIGGRVPAFP
jgi:IclR family acetate operon transcriptional repressor